MKRSSTLFQDNQLDWTTPGGGPGPAFNAFEIVNASELSWDVVFYRVTSKNTKVARAVAKNAVWKAREFNKGRGVKGLGFIVDVADDLVAVPAAWCFDEGQPYADCFLRRERTVVARLSADANPDLVSRILEDGMRWRLKEIGSDHFGPLWRDYGDFCQMPPTSHGQGGTGSPRFAFCRRLGLKVRALADNRWVVRFVVGTATIDGRSMADYYAKGEVDRLVEMVEAKRLNRLDRRSREVDIHVWHNKRSKLRQDAEVLTFTNPEVLTSHARLGDDGDLQHGGTFPEFGENARETGVQVCRAQAQESGGKLDIFGAVA